MALALEKEFRLLQAFAQNDTLSASFLTSNKKEVLHLKELGLLSGQPAYGGNGIAYWNDADITAKGQKALRHLQAYKFLQEMSDQAWQHTMSLNSDQLKLFNFLKRNNLIIFSGKITPTMDGDNIASFNQAEILDYGYDLLDLFDVEDIEDFFKNSRSNGGSSVNVNIQGDGNLNGINQIGGNDNSQTNSAPVENHIHINQAQRDSLHDVSDFIKEMSENDAKQLKIVLQSIKDDGSWNSDISQEESFLERHPNLQKGINVLLDIMKESGKAVAISYLSQHFPVIFGFLRGI
ncbi:hypothetical protein [Oenococcus sicerae]|uniref:Uncharacterized protein n=1 Tax=Oenococcus sicerae TaxID=2203724 RepID=A0AAJ1RCW9_9LACO|nr:hypothetical protein [Oenococcus sicerae]MDN6900660.1 hypothetical protein [Oenococcus sicerae]